MARAGEARGAVVDENREEVGDGSHCRCLSRLTRCDLLYDTSDSLYDSVSLATAVKVALMRAGHEAADR